MPPPFDLHVRGCEPLDLADPLVAHAGMQSAQPVGGREVGERPQALSEVRQQGGKRRVVEGGEAKIGEGRRQPAGPNQKRSGRGLGGGSHPRQVARRLAGEDRRRRGGVGDGGRRLLEHEVEPGRAEPCLDLLARRVPEQFLPGREIGRRRRLLVQPGSLHRRSQPHVGLPARILKVDRQEQRFPAKPRALQPHAPASHERAAILRARPLTGEAIGERVEQRPHRGSLGIGGAIGERRRDESMELLGRAEHRLRAGGVGIEGRVFHPPAGLKNLQGQHPVDHVGPRADGMAITRAAVPRRAEGVAFREQRRRERRLPQHAVLGPGQQQSREPRMGRQARERAAQRRDPVAARVVGGNGPQPSQERGRPLDRLARGLVEPGKIVFLADRQELEQRPGEVFPQGLGRLRGRTVVVGCLVPEPPADAGLGTARAAGPLVSRRLRDRHEFEPRQARARRDP